MKKSLVLFMLLLLSSKAAQALDVSISYATFQSAEDSYVEVYFHIEGNTVVFVPIGDSTFQSQLEVVILFKQNEEVVKFDKYCLTSPVYDKPSSFVDLKRYSMANGKYDLEVSVQDLNMEGNIRKFNTSLSVDFNNESIGQSDIQLLASVREATAGQAQSPFVKNGLVFEPLPSNFYDKYAQSLLFYNEIYRADKVIADDFLVSYSIQKDDAPGKAISIGHKRKSPAPVIPFLQQIDITQLESGNYVLSVEVRNRAKELLSKKSIFFQRSNPYLNVEREDIAQGTTLEEEFVANMTQEELRYSLKAISMQVASYDGELMNTLIKEKNLDAMRLYLFSFWAKENPTNPKAAYDAYMEVAKGIDEQFQNGFGYGFETDRGYVYMKYGVPNDITTVENDPSAPPYEIWSYNEFPQTGQNNVKFLFYNPSLAHNGFVLLHSNARGEVSNPRWEVELYRDAPNDLQGNNFIDGTRMQDNTGRYARRLFNDY
ncbi:MAG: GWxTD domain-containing protein [Saprospiraceae bacterium]